MPTRPRLATQPAPIPPHAFKHGEPYRYGNSPQAVDDAVREGLHWIDLDDQVTADLIHVAAHWHKPALDGFTDPLGKIPASARYDQLTWRQVARLRGPNGERLHSMRSMIRYAHARGVGVEIEAKQDKRLQQAATWAPIMLTVKRLGARVLVKTLTSIPGCGQRLRAVRRAARAAGLTIPTVILPRGSLRVRRAWWPWITWHRGPVKWVGVRPLWRK